MQIELCDINYTIIEVKYGILIHVRSLPTINQISIVISSKYIHVYIVMTGLFNIIKMKFKFSIERGKIQRIPACFTFVIYQMPESADKRIWYIRNIIKPVLRGHLW